MSLPKTDYPLLLPCSVARLWTWSGGISLDEPQILSLVNGIGVLVALFATVCWLRGPLLAAAASIACLAYPKVWLWAAMQYSDLLLASYFVLAAGMIVAAENDRDHSASYLLLAGFFSGSAAWCKNEGLAFVALAFVLALGLVRNRGGARSWSSVRRFCVGGAVAGLPVLILRLGFLGESSEAHVRWRSLTDLVLDPERHRVILENLARPSGVLDSLRELQLAPLWGPSPFFALAAVALALGLSARLRVARADLAPLALAVGLGATYYLVLVTTSLDLQWHLDTALDRLMLQLWPLSLLGLACLLQEREIEGLR